MTSEAQCIIFTKSLTQLSIHRQVEPIPAANKDEKFFTMKTVRMEQASQLCSLHPWSSSRPSWKSPEQSGVDSALSCLWAGGWFWRCPKRSPLQPEWAWDPDGSTLLAAAAWKSLGVSQVLCHISLQQQMTHTCHGIPSCSTQAWSQNGRKTQISKYSNRNLDKCT